MSLSWPYPQHAHTPYWGTINSAANFCEEDNIITPYIAEFINTLTNVTYLYYAFHGIKSNSNRHDAILRNLPYLGIALVGIGSAVFHSTLINYLQWCDELSMHIATLTVLHRVMTFDKSLAVTVSSGLISSILMAAFITWHCMTDELLGHSILFGVMIVAVGLKTRSIISHRVPAKAVRCEVKKLATWGAVFFVSGFVLWNIDQIICSQLTTLKRAIGMPWSFVFELHGWWHIFTGMGAYIFIALVEYLTSDEAGQPLGKNFAWPVAHIVNCSAGSPPVLNGAALNGHVKETSNGHAKETLNGDVKSSLNGGVKENGNGHVANGHVANGHATNGHANGGALPSRYMANGKKTS